LGHHPPSIAADLPSDPRGGRSSMKLESGGSHDRSSMSIGSLQKKRISWGPSKIVEFFPAERFQNHEGSGQPSKPQGGGILKKSTARLQGLLLSNNQR